MHIVFGTDVFYPFLEGGGEVHTFNVAKNLVKFGHEVTVISGKSSQFPDDPFERLSSLKNEEYVEGIHIIRAKKPYPYGATFSSFPALCEMYRLVKNMIKKKEVDIVNFVLYRPVIPFYFASRGKIPTTLTVHLLSSGYGTWKGWMSYDGGLFGGFAQKVIEEVVLRLPYDKIITVSKVLADQIASYYPKTKIEIVYNGVDLKKYDKVKCKEKDVDQLIYIGALKKRKNVLDAIKVVKEARKILKRDLKLVIVSGGGELENIILKLMRKYKFIRYYKKANEELKIKLLKESSLLLFPSSYESFGIVTIEGLACRTPFIAYDIPAMREVTSLTSGGVLVSYKNIGEFVKKLCELLKNERIIKELGKTGRKNVEKNFTWEKVAKREEKIFLELINLWKRK